MQIDTEENANMMKQTPEIEAETKPKVDQQRRLTSINYWNLRPEKEQNKGN